MPVGRPLKFPTPEIMQKQIDAYFDKCDETEEPYTITGLAMALDTTRLTLIDYNDKPAFTNTVKKAKLRVENYAEKMLLAGSNAAGSIFALKNHGWSDRQDLKVSGDPENPLFTEIIIKHVKP